MWYVFLVIVVVPLVYALAMAVYYHGKFRQTEAYSWRCDILHRFADVRREFDEASEDRPATDYATIRERYFAEYLHTIRIDGLAGFTGIGPGTVDRLRQARLRTLGEAIDYPFQRLPGIGPAKSADLRAAVRALVEEARRTFDAGGCDAGRRYREYSERLRRDEKTVEADRIRHLRQIKEKYDELKPKAAVARGITLWNFFWRDGQYPGYRPEVPVVRREAEERSSPAESDVDNDVFVTMLPANSTPAKMSSHQPSALNVTIQCATCDAKLHVSSSKQRSQFRVTCPRCSAVSTITMPAKAPPPPMPVIRPLPVAMPVPPPAPIPANTLPAARPTVVNPASPPRTSVPPPAVPRMGSMPTLARETPPRASVPPPVRWPDDLFANASKTPTPGPAAPIEHLELPKLRAFAGFGLMIAKADGRIAKAERVAVRDFLVTLFGHDPALVRHIDPVIEATEKAVPTELLAVAEVVRRTRLEERRTIFQAAVRIADACGKQNRQEIETLERVAVGLGLDEAKPAAPKQWESIWQPTSIAPQAVSETAKKASAKPPETDRQPDVPDPRKTLEIEPEVQLTAELIRRRFTMLFEKADPVKAGVFGPEVVALIEKKRLDLQTAALTLLAPFDEPLEPPAAPPPPTDIRHNPDLDDVFG